MVDLQEKNIMLRVEDESILVDFEEAEKSSPSPRKVVGDRVIYTSRKLGLPKIHGRPVLSDFGEARFASSVGTHWEDIQPLIYRAPEVLLGMPWDHKVDICNLGVLVCVVYVSKPDIHYLILITLQAWDLFEQGHLFYARDSDKKILTAITLLR